MPSYIVTIDQSRSWTIHVQADDRKDAKQFALNQMRGDGWDYEPEYIGDFEVANVEETGHD